MRTTPPAWKEDVKDRLTGQSIWPANKGRDGERTPMQLDPSTNAGFTTGDPWLPVPSSAKDINVIAEEGDPDSLLAWYRTLIKLKKTNPALGRGFDVMLDTKNDRVLSWSSVGFFIPCSNHRAEPILWHLTTLSFNRSVYS